MSPAFCLRRHVGVSDTGGAGCDCQYLIAVRLLSGGGSLVGELSGFLLVDDGEELLGGLCRLQLSGKVLVHEHLHEPCQNLQMNVAVHGGSDHEDQLAGCAVG